MFNILLIIEGKMSLPNSAKMFLLLSCFNEMFTLKLMMNNKYEFLKMIDAFQPNFILTTLFDREN